MNAALIQSHIESFNPKKSHYRREHAPDMRYLPSDLTIAHMHQDFISQVTTFQCPYEKYRSVVSEMNISFAHLGHEECESCEKFWLHNSEHTKDNVGEQCTTCDICQVWKNHHEKYTESQKLYQQDVERNLFCGLAESHYATEAGNV